MVIARGILQIRTGAVNRTQRSVGTELTFKLRPSARLRLEGVLRHPSQLDLDLHQVKVRAIIAQAIRGVDSSRQLPVSGRHCCLHRCPVPCVAHGFRLLLGRLKGRE